MMIKVFKLLFIGLLCCGLLPLAHADLIKIGMLSSQSFEQDMKQWQPTADYLSKRIPQHFFQILPYQNAQELHADAARGKFDFIFTSPVSFVYLEEKLGATPLITLQYKYKQQVYDKTASLLITRAENQHLNQLSDIKGQSLMATSADMLDGWLQASFELHKNKIAKSDFASLAFAQGKPERVVEAVLKGEVTVGAIPAGVLEKMIHSKKVNADKLNFINSKYNPVEFPFVYSTSLAPQWPLAKLGNAHSSLAQQVTEALLDMPQHHHALKSAGYAGWTVPGDYRPVQHLMQSLYLAPYDNTLQRQLMSLLGFWLNYFYWIIGGTCLFMLMVLSPIQIMRHYRQRRLQLSRRIRQPEFLTTTHF